MMEVTMLDTMNSLERMLQDVGTFLDAPVIKNLDGHRLHEKVSVQKDISNDNFDAEINKLVENFKRKVNKKISAKELSISAASFKYNSEYNGGQSTNIKFEIALYK